MHQYKVEVSRRFGLKILCVSLRQSSLKLWSIKAKIHPLLLGRMFRELLLLNMEVWRGDEASVSCCKFLSLLQEVREERKLTTQGLCTCKPLLQYIFFFKLTSHSILHYLWSADLWKNFDQLIMSIFIFSRYFFPRGKLLGYNTLLIPWFIDFKITNDKIFYNELHYRSVT